MEDDAVINSYTTLTDVTPVQVLQPDVAVVALVVRQGLGPDAPGPVLEAPLAVRQAPQPCEQDAVQRG
jgi:hypothetical protein